MDRQGKLNSLGNAEYWINEAKEGIKEDIERSRIITRIINARISLEAILKRLKEEQEEVNRYIMDSIDFDEME